MNDSPEAPASIASATAGPVLFWTPCLSLLAVDQASKQWAVRESERLVREPVEVIDGLLRFTYVTNPGAAFSLFSGSPGILTVLAGLALVAIFLFRRQLELDQPANQLLFGLICGGISGNLWDRLFRGGEVVDFIDAYLPFFKPIDDLDILPIQLANWPVFNLADSGIFIGVIWFVIRGFRKSAREQTEKSSGEDDHESAKPE